ncbi:hypothetical protein COV81_02500 [Candidatus Peregrinibacteria bacterium CG11_big_fil_rev_8_21_14_0_20_41_10]|nr:MAG: hypothetical protein COV81_02500 [Candidatus Peregrinibacteria bacterium CG11_big_fil_rev_8_21_14_0_20_41_10]PIZ77583.1 MAG: hypothetical protein COY06_00500 [Candidatus Peregrinibacteria bacterium CG_4_10_14_0_2_um_filter_41_8]PJC38384.1 MAG: hypothetical protein CO045_00675 [Candidatus Peregrinibacteria bacterium CG_4_9_14_0_2_um_filter_41_14]
MEFTLERQIKLAKGWVKGDQKAFSELYDHLADKVYRYIYFKIKGSEVEDLVELTFLKAWEGRGSFDNDKSSFSTWIFTIARNVVIDYYRSQKETIDLADVADVIASDKLDSPKEATEKELDKENLSVALQQLDEPYREIIVLRYLEDFAYEEIAEMLDKSEGSVRVLNFRGLKKLKQIMKDLDMIL